MRQRKKGFTLLELLAVIVILAIIALIATPIILNVIENARKGSAESSANGYIDALEYTTSKPNLNEGNAIEDGVYDVLKLDVALKGEKPTYGEVTIKKGNVVSGELCIGGYEINYENGNAKANRKCNLEIDTTAPVLNLDKEIITTDSIIIPFKTEDKESSIKSVVCNYETSGVFNAGIIEGNLCELKDLQPGVTYNVEVISTNKTNLSTTKKLKIKTGSVNVEFDIVNIPEDTIYAQEKHITIKYNTSNLTKEAYYVKTTMDIKSNIKGYDCGNETMPTNCSEDSFKTYKKDTWYKVLENPELIMKENGSLYALVYDGSKYIMAKTMSITTIDTAAPLLKTDVIKLTTNSIEIPFVASDSESGVKSTICEYGETKEYGLSGSVVNKESGPCKIEDIKQGTKYYYKLTTTDNSGRVSIVEGDNETKTIEAPVWSITPTNWSVTKTATVTFNGKNITKPVYFIKTTEKVTLDVEATACDSSLPKKAIECTGTKTKTLNKDIWYMIPGNANIEVTENGSLYSYTSDGTNIASSSVLSITTIDKLPPELSLGTATSSTNSISVPFEASDYTTLNISCVYGENDNYGKTGTVTYSKDENTEKIGNCVINNIKEEATYYYKIVAEDSAGIKTVKLGNTKTKVIVAPTWAVNTTEWTTSKTATVTFNGTGITSPEYYIKSTVAGTITTGSKTQTCGTGTEPSGCTGQTTTAIAANTWYRVSGNTSINVTENGSMYALTSDGTNTKSSTTLTITTVDTAVPNLTLGTVTRTTNNITIPYTASDSQSGVSVGCVYGTNTNYGSTGTISGNNCVISNANQGTTYYYKLTATDGAGRKTEKTGSTATASITAPTWAVNSTSWTTSKTATVTFSGANITSPAYYIKSTVAGTITSGSKQQVCGTGTSPAGCTSETSTAIAANYWYRVSGNTSINVTSNGSMYAMTSDGTNTKSSSTLTISSVDTTAPSLTLGTISTTTNSITIPYTASDSQSGVSVACVYGTSTSYGTNGTISGNNCVLSGRTQGTTYYYKVIATDGAGRKTEKTGSTATASITAPTWAVNSTSWTTSKTATVTFSGANITSPAYYIKSTVAGTITSGSKQQVCGTGTSPAGCTSETSTAIAANYWYRVSGNTSINVTANGSMYAMTSDGTNTKSSSTLTISSVDTTAPTTPTSVVRYGSSSGTVRSNSDTSWTNQVLWWGSFSSTETQSGINRYEYSVGCTGTVSGTLSSYHTYSSTVNYTFCIRAVDNVGRTSGWSSATYIKVDKTNPTCTNSGDSTSWTSGNRIIYYGCSDSNSGCNASYSGGSSTINWTASTVSIGAYTIKDNAGNQVTCPARTANAYVDKTAPTCSSSGDSTSWTSGDRIIYKSGSDSGSGLASGTGSVTVNYTATTVTIPAYTLTDKVGWQTTCPARTANAYVDKNDPTCTNSGDSTSWTAGNRTIYYGCSDVGSGCNGSYSGGSATYTTTTKQATIGAYTIKDNSGRTVTCSARTANVYVDKTSPTLVVNAYKTTTKSEASGYTARTAYTSNTWYSGWVWVDAAAVDSYNSTTLYYTRTPDATYGGSGEQNKTVTSVAGATANTKNYSDAIGISYYKYYACDSLGNCTYSSASPYTFTVKLDRVRDTFGVYHCIDGCTTSCNDWTHATLATNVFPKDASGQCGTVMIKITFDQSTNVLNYYVRQGGDTDVGKSAYIYLKNNDTVLATIKASGTSYAAGADWEGSVTLSPGLYTKIWVDSNSSNAKYDKSVGKLIVT